MIQPRRQDQTDLFQRKEAWVADGEGEEKQTGLRAEQVSQLLGCRGEGEDANRGSLPAQNGAPTDQFIFPEVKCIDLNRNPAHASKAPEKH